MNKQQREELQDRARYFNGMFARWRKQRTDENFAALEDSMESMYAYWTEAKIGQT